MRYLHTMVRVTDLEASLEFYVNVLGMTEIKRVDYSSGRFTLIFLAAPDDSAEKKNIDSPLIELTYNCLLYTSPSPRDGLLSRMPSSA